MLARLALAAVVTIMAPGIHKECEQMGHQQGLDYLGCWSIWACL